MHGANAARVYAEHVVDAANQTFDRALAEPVEFQYRASDPEFDVWGYQATLRANPMPGLLQLRNARLDGTSFTVSGRGLVNLTTPPHFAPGRAHQVTITPPDGLKVTVTSTADQQGRVPVCLDLGSSGVEAPPDMTCTPITDGTDVSVR